MSTDRVMQDNGNGVEEKMIRKLDLEKQMSESLRHMRTEMSLIIALINQLTGKEYIVIFNRYVMCEAITETCKNLDISESTYWRINRHAILKLSK
jgi:DNA-directed RNA polymerase specialized sigma subunit